MTWSMQRMLWRECGVMGERKTGGERDLSPVKIHSKPTTLKGIKGRNIITAHAKVRQIPQFVVCLSEMSIFDRKFKHLQSKLLTNYYCLLKPWKTLADIFNSVFCVVCLSASDYTKLPAQYPRVFEGGMCIGLKHAHPSQVCLLDNRTI